MSIEELTKIENELLVRMPDRGSFEDRDKYLEGSGIYEVYRSIFDQYVDLALGGNLEALKRALFYLWYQVSEPAPLSGLKNLDIRGGASALEYLNKLLSNGKNDSELEWMLPYYYSVAGWYIPNEIEVEAISALSQASSERYMSKLSESNFTGRGLLGKYWSSIQL